MGNYKKEVSCVSWYLSHSFPIIMPWNSLLTIEAVHNLSFMHSSDHLFLSFHFTTLLKQFSSKSPLTSTFISTMINLHSSFGFINSICYRWSLSPLFVISFIIFYWISSYFTGWSLQVHYLLDLLILCPRTQTFAVFSFLSVLTPLLVSFLL